MLIKIFYFKIKKISIVISCILFLVFIGTICELQKIYHKNNNSELLVDENNVNSEEKQSLLGKKNKAGK